MTNPLRERPGTLRLGTAGVFRLRPSLEWHVVVDGQRVTHKNLWCGGFQIGSVYHDKQEARHVAGQAGQAGDLQVREAPEGVYHCRAMGSGPKEHGVLERTFVNPVLAQQWVEDRADEWFTRLVEGCRAEPVKDDAQEAPRGQAGA